jgi:hypothetical protein
VSAAFASLRRGRRAIVALALLALLAAQAALASYACPQRGAPARLAQALPCHEIDPAAPALCKAFVQDESAVADHPRPAPDLGGAALAYALPAPPAPTGVPAPHAVRRAHARAPPPPLWIVFGRRRD